MGQGAGRWAREWGPGGGAGSPDPNCSGSLSFFFFFLGLAKYFTIHSLYYSSENTEVLTSQPTCFHLREPNHRYKMTF